jgi:gliding motility-associated-like protein
MRTTLLITIAILFGYCNLFAQQPGDSIITKPVKISTKQNTSRVLSEICGNNADDDGNGLKDCEDYSCYYSSSTVCNCEPIDIVWIGDDNGDLFWVNHQTGVETYIGNMGRSMTDITWTPDGNLYGVDWVGNKIWKINPATAQTTFVTAIPGYDFSNALTSDGNGNLYLASRLAFAGNTFHIIKFNLASGIVTIVADLTPTFLTSAGDLAFHNETLYLACSGNILASIDPSNGQITSSYILGLPGGANIYGIVVKADGTVYLSDVNRLYSLNLSTMQAGLYYSCSTPNLYIWGMANFNDYCMSPAAAPICNARVTIDILSNQPYCGNPGVLLKANGSGIIAGGVYKWTLPDGSNLATQNITATKSGIYKVRYSTTPDTCGWQDSLAIQITLPPDSRLGPDTSLCTNSQITFTPTNTTNVTSYLWQDGSTNIQLSTSQPGLYWLQTWNACGSFRDSVIVTHKSFANVDLGPNREICEYDTLHLKNFLDGPGYNYTWSNNSTGKTMIATGPGKYWVDVINRCGKISDTIIVVKKIDGCECSLYMPSAFTPNNDGKNELIKAFSNCPVMGQLKIFNRWGQLVYQTNDLQNGWNGVYNNMPQTTGVYVYQVSYKYIFRPGEFMKKGTFVLIR